MTIFAPLQVQFICWLYWSTNLCNPNVFKILIFWPSMQTIVVSIYSAVVIIIFQVRTEAGIFQEFFGHCAA